MKKNAAPQEPPPADAAGFERFQAELLRLVAQFEKNFKQYQSAAYDEASVRQEFLNPLFRALGWDVENKLGHIPQHREVEIESRTQVSGRQKRADYLFRTDRQDRFVCEAKKPAETLHAGYAFQAKRYAWNKGLVLAVLSDFEEIKIYLVGSKPRPDDVEAGEWTTWHFLEYAKHARALWDLLSRDAVASGSIERLVASLPRKPKAKTKTRQQWLFKPERARAIDADFLDFLDEARRGLASDLIRRNDRADLLEGTRLDEAVQRILDRLLFLRICEDRDIDTGRPLATILKTWRDRKDTPLWRDVVAHFRALDRRPASHIPWFNGNLFKEHFSESLAVSDEWIAGFLEETGDDESAYLFNVIPVEILGTIYERFLGKTVRPHGRGVVIEEKPEVRKAGGVYYTPRYIVDYIVEQTLGKLLEGKAPAESLKLRVLDPACGSGSFLIRAYERLCEHWQIALTKDEKLRRKADGWTDPDTGDVHLTTDLKRRILTASIYGVDLDPGAVEVTQLSLYLKMLEGESRATLAKNRELFGPDVPLLPPLQDNVKCGNSLIASDFSLNPDDLLRVRAFDWDEGFRDIMKNGGFDAVIGNPPYIQIENIPVEHRKYYTSTYGENGKLGKRYDIYQVFVLRGIALLRPNGRVGHILPNTFLMGHSYETLRRRLLTQGRIAELVDLPQGVFQGVTVDNVLLFYVRDTTCSPLSEISIHKLNPKSDKSRVARHDWDESFGIDHSSVLKDAALRINLHTNPEQAKLFGKIEASGICLGDITESSQGNIIYETQADAQKGRYTSFQQQPGWKRLLRGKNIARYETIWGGEYVSYGNWLWRHREERFFNQDKILLHAMRNKSLARRLVATLDTDFYYNAHNLANIIHKADSNYSLRFVLGIFNSQLINYWYRAHFPNVNINPSEFRQIPLPKIDFSNPSSRARHDKLVALVDKMLLLAPKLRSAKSDGDRATLQNAVSATDRAIDALVYELYGLTADEIALVEGSAK